MNTRLLLASLGLLVGTISAAVAAAPRPPLLANGTPAPDFTALKADNSPAKLSDFRGKVVLLDFWSTWCGPCKATMPHLEKLHQKLGSQGLVVLGVCVWDDRAKFDGWLKSPEVKTSYLKVFDPAARASADSIARKLYSVSGIPTFYLIDAQGKILFSGVGSGPKTEAGLNDALKQAGFKL
ncbi:MAG: TlpA family protein disulfide reductase [Verrucomicrobia bacterium]|nr:TlpA family protein disulfide reductase [Verrucomicrobiota bacterium]